MESNEQVQKSMPVNFLRDVDNILDNSGYYKYNGKVEEFQETINDIINNNSYAPSQAIAIANNMRLCFISEMKRQIKKIGKPLTLNDQANALHTSAQATLYAFSHLI